MQNFMGRTEDFGADSVILGVGKRRFGVKNENFGAKVEFKVLKGQREKWGPLRP